MMLVLSRYKILIEALETPGDFVVRGEVQGKQFTRAIGPRDSLAQTVRDTVEIIENELLQK